MSFAEILKTFKKPPERGDIMPQVDRYLLALDGREMMDYTEERAKDCFHPSELSTNNCVRSIVYRWLKVPQTNKQTIRPQIKRVFDVGHHKGYILQQYFWDMGRLEGMYKCMVCKNEWWDVSPKKCKKCKTELLIWHNLRYEEVPIHNEKWNIKGKSDGIFLDDNGKRIALEFKSIKNRDKQTPENSITFDELNQAKAEHVYQLNMYMDAMDEAGLNIERGVIIYFAKNNQLIKEFPIRKMDLMLDPSYGKINQTNHALENKYLPPRAGRIKSDIVCTYCPFKNHCWNNDYSFEESDHRLKEIKINSEV